MANTNAVKFGLSKAHYAVYDEAAATYGTPVPIPGAVSISISPEGSENTFYADNIAYFVSNANAGYSGDMEVAELPRQAYIDLLGQSEDSAGVLIEANEDVAKTFALLFEVSGNLREQRFVFYNCTLSRPSAEANTTEESITPTTDKLTIRMIPRPFDIDGEEKNVVKGSVTNEDATKDIYKGWYEEVHVPTNAAGDTQPDDAPSV